MNTSGFEEDVVDGALAGPADAVVMILHSCPYIQTGVYKIAGCKRFRIFALQQYRHKNMNY